MIGLLTFSEQIFCNKEVLGKAFLCEISGVRVKIVFPRLPAIDNNDTFCKKSITLLSPDIFECMEDAGESISWGYPMRYPTGDCCIETVAISIECDINQYDQIIYSAIDRWEHSFIDYIKLATGQNTERDKNISRTTCRLELYEQNYIADKRNTELYIVFPNPDLFATEDIINSAIAFASSGKEFLIEYQLILSAYEARRNNQNRRAILDACSAAEITIVNRIKEYCDSIDLDYSVLLEKYRSLGDYFTLLNKLNIEIPRSDYKKTIVCPRNDIMHNRNIYPTDETTEKLIECVEDILEFLHNEYY